MKKGAGWAEGWQRTVWAVLGLGLLLVGLREGWWPWAILGVVVAGWAAR